MIRSTGSILCIGALLAACSPASNDEAPAPEPTVEATAPETTEPVESEPAPETEPEAELDTDLAIETVGYPDGWELQPYWSGEYPNAFSVTQEGVTVMGHSVITYEEYPPIYCGLPHKATYSPWNSDRRETDNLEFVAMVYPTTFTIGEDVSVEAFVGDSNEVLELKAGDQLIYKNYIAEGFFVAEKDGIQYEMNEADLPQSTEFEQGPEDQEWVLVSCTNADNIQAWVRFEDAMSTPGVERYEYTGFAEASDLP